MKSAINSVILMRKQTPFTMKTLTFISFLFAISSASFAQEFEVPEVELKTEKDYEAHESDAINTFDWLMKTPANEHVDKRQAAGTFLFTWISGTPKVHIEIKPKIVTFMDNKSPEFFIIFAGAWAKYSLESKDFDDKIKGTTAGIDAVIEYYNKNKGLIPESKAVEKYVVMKEKGTLNDYIRKNA